MSSRENNSRSSTIYFVFVVALMLAAFFYLPGLLGGASIETLADTALNGATQKDQIRAAQELSRQGGPALQALRNVARQSQNASVVSVCILAISRQRDYPSMDLLLAKLDDSESGVRSSAATALNKMLGRDYHFPAQGNKETRKRVRDQIAKDWESYNGSELFEHNKNRFNKDE